MTHFTEDNEVNVHEDDASTGIPPMFIPFVSYKAWNACRPKWLKKLNSNAELFFPMDQIIAELSTIHWVFFTLSLTTTLFFSLLASQKRRGNMIPQINLFVSIIVLTNYLTLATLESTVQPTIFLELAITLPIMFYQTLLLTGSDFTYTFLVIVLHELHVLSLFIFMQATFPYAWIWLTLSVVYWFGIVLIMLYPSQTPKQHQNPKVPAMYLIATVVLLLSEALFVADLALLKVGLIHPHEFFLVLGGIDFISRGGLGVYFCLNWGVFSDLVTYEPVNQEPRTDGETQVRQDPTSNRPFGRPAGISEFEESVSVIYQD